MVNIAQLNEGSPKIEIAAALDGPSRRSCPESSVFSPPYGLSRGPSNKGRQDGASPNDPLDDLRLVTISRRTKTRPVRAHVANAWRRHPRRFFACLRCAWPSLPLSPADAPSGFGLTRSETHLDEYLKTMRQKTRADLPVRRAQMCCAGCTPRLLPFLRIRPRLVTWRKPACGAVLPVSSDR